MSSVSRRAFLGGGAAALGAPILQALPRASQALRERLVRALRQGPIFNTHEHLIPESERLRAPIDVFTLIEHYAVNDAISAGMEPKIAAALRRSETPVRERWKTFEPYWRRARNTGYCRVVEIVARDLCGVAELSSETCERASDALRRGNTAGIYRRMLEERMKVEWSVLDDYWNARPLAPEYPRFVTARRFDRYAQLRSREGAARLAEAVGRDIRSFDQLVAALDSDFAENLRHRMVAVKSGLAYSRVLRFEAVARADAERAFDALPEKVLDAPSRSAGFREPPARPLADFVVHRIVQLARDAKVPVQFHTGIQSGTGSDLANSSPMHLVNLFLDYPDVRFDVFHAGFPWVTELGALAKMFRNVAIDLTWMHILGPTTARRALAEYLDTVPSSKIFGFGGDYRYVENSYGHLVIAVDNIARTLADRIEDGIYTESQALDLGRGLLYRNPKEFFAPERVAQP